MAGVSSVIERHFYTHGSIGVWSASVSPKFFGK